MITLGADFHIGLPETSDGRVAEQIPPQKGIAELEGIDMESVAVRTLASCPLTGAEPNTRAWRAAEIPAAGGAGNARSVARIHSHRRRERSIRARSGADASHDERGDLVPLVGAGNVSHSVHGDEPAVSDAVGEGLTVSQRELPILGSMDGQSRR